VSRNPSSRVNTTHAKLDAEWAKLSREVKVDALRYARQRQERLKQIRDPAWQEEQQRLREDHARRYREWLDTPG
jgi:Skp family chaperone for outer membrane proteins